MQTLSGDAVRETFQHTEDPSSALRSFVGNLQLLILVLIFTYIVVNCSVAIVEGKFFATFSTEAREVIMAHRARQVRLRSQIQNLLTRSALGPR